MRKVYAVAGAGHGDGSRLNLRFAWPSGSWGSLPLAGGLEAAYRRALAERAHQLVRHDLHHGPKPRGPRP